MFPPKRCLTEGQGARGFPIAQDSYPSKEPPWIAAPRHRGRCPLAVRRRAPPMLASPRCRSGVCKGGGHGASASRPCSITGSRLRTAPLLMRKHRSFLGFVPLQGPSRRPEIPLPPPPSVPRSHSKETCARKKLRSVPAAPEAEARREDRPHRAANRTVWGTMPEGLAPDRPRAIPKESGGGRAHRARPKPPTRASNRGREHRSARSGARSGEIPSTVHRAKRVHRWSERPAEAGRTARRGESRRTCRRLGHRCRRSLSRAEVREGAARGGCPSLAGDPRRPSWGL